MALDNNRGSINNVYMHNSTNNFASYQAKYATYLLSMKYSDSSVKSTISDVEHFFNWAEGAATHQGFRLSQKNTLESVFNFRAIEQYLSFFSQRESQASVTRRLAALRGFSQLAVSEKWLNSKINLAFQMLAERYQAMLKSSANLTKAFSEKLKQTNQNKNTLRGYVADIEEYLQITSLI